MNMDVEEDANEADNFHSFSGHKLLLDVDADLDSNDVDNIKFFCIGIIGMGKLQKMERGLDVFDELEKLTKIRPDKNNFEFLVEILCRIHRFDLVKKLGEFGSGFCKNAKKKYKDGDFTRTQLTPLRILLYNIAEDMEEKEFQEVVFLLGKKFGKANMKKMRNMLEVFTFLEREQELEAENVEILKYIVNNLQVKRTDLLDKVREYEKYPWKRGRCNPDVEMPLAQNQNNQRAQTMHETVAVPVSRGPEYLSGNEIIHISAALSVRPDWMKLIPALGLTQEEFEASVNGYTSPHDQICKMLLYWKDIKQKDCKECGQILYVALQSVGFDSIASQLADEEHLPGVAVYPIEYDREQSDLNQQVAQQPPDIPEGQVIRDQLQQVGAEEPAVRQPPPQSGQNTGPPRGEVAGQPHLEESISRAMPDIANAAVTGVQRGVTGTQGPSVGRSQQQANANEVGRVMGSGEAAPPTQPPPVNDITGIVQAARTMNMDVDDLPSYKMDVTPRGYAVIINNNTFFQDRDDRESKEMPHRTGTERDAARLKYIFQKLDFIVESYDDLQDYQMCQKMSACAARSHRNFDCFVCCILSHGAAGHVYGVNGKLIRIDVLTSFFRSQNCPTLAGKPKLFFIQACQGRQKQEGYDIEQDTAPEQKRPDLVEDLQRELIPDEADFLLGYATVPGYVSYRSRSQGSWYVNKLVEMLDKYASRYDLMSIMVKVNEEVGRANANVDGGRYKQIPAPLVTLRKKLYFR